MPTKNLLVGFLMSGHSVHTINEIDEALAHLAQVPEAKRGPAWYAYLNTLLDAKNKTKDNG